FIELIKNNIIDPLKFDYSGTSFLYTMLVQKNYDVVDHALENEVTRGDLLNMKLTTKRLVTIKEQIQRLSIVEGKDSRINTIYQKYISEPKANLNISQLPNS